MTESNTRLVEHTAVTLLLDGDLGIDHARWLRGSMGQQFARPEFHHHGDAGLVYQHPQIRYHTAGHRAMLLGLDAGALLLRGLPDWETLRLGPREYRVLEQCRTDGRAEIGPMDAPVAYRFETPYLALNQENYVRWSRACPGDRRPLLDRIIVGNLLSLSKSISLNVTERLTAQADLEPVGEFDLKPGVSLLGFRGTIRMNFSLPNFWGIGKSSARGFGTLAREGV